MDHDDYDLVDEQEAPLDLSSAFAFVDADWMDDALCAQTDPESFFPEKGGSTRDAKATCSSCMVQAECLDWALANEERFGIWGGFSERERRALKKTLTGSQPEVAASALNPSTPSADTPEGAAA